MKKLGSFLLALAMIASFTACGSSYPQNSPAPNTVQTTVTPQTQPEAPAPAAETETPVDTEPESPTPESGSRILVVYFSRTGEQYSVGVIEKGNTAIVADMIAAATGADIYELLPADDYYPMTYKELTDIALQEQRSGARPAIAGELPDLNGYDTIFIGAPVWWGDWPMICYTFFESEPMTGKTLIPFSTHAGSGLSGFDTKLARVYPDCTIAKGLAIAGTDAQNNPDRVSASVSSWLQSLGF